MRIKSWMEMDSERMFVNDLISAYVTWVAQSFFQISREKMKFSLPLKSVHISSTSYNLKLKQTLIHKEVDNVLMDLHGLLI